MSQARSTSTGRVQAHRARKQLGVQIVVIEVPDQQVDYLAEEGYLDGDNTVVQAIEAFLSDHLDPPKHSRLS